MGAFLYLPIWLALAAGCPAEAPAGTADDRDSLERTTRAIRDGFARGDVSAVVALHHPDVIKYFGGANVVKGRAAMEKGLSAMFKDSKVEFIDNRVESMLFQGETAVETSIFRMRVTSKASGRSRISSGRAMVVYVRHKGSPTGWASIREMTQAAPTEE